MEEKSLLSFHMLWRFPVSVTHTTASSPAPCWARLQSPQASSLRHLAQQAQIDHWKRIRNICHLLSNVEKAEPEIKEDDRVGDGVCGKAGKNHTLCNWRKEGADIGEQSRKSTITAPSPGLGITGRWFCMATSSSAHYLSKSTRSCVLLEEITQKLLGISLGDFARLYVYMCMHDHMCTCIHQGMCTYVWGSSLVTPHLIH